MNVVKYASAVVALIVAISGGLWAFDNTYLRYALFQQHEAKHYKQEIFVNQKMIWGYEDRLKKNPNDEEAQKRIRELELENEFLKGEFLKGGAK